MINNLSEQKRFFAIFLFAFLLHVAAFFFIHEMEIGFHFPLSKSNEGEKGLLDEAVCSVGEERSKQLQETFLTVYQQERSEKDTEAPFQGVQKEPLDQLSYDFSEDGLEMDLIEEESLTASPLKPIPTETLIEDLNLFQFVGSDEEITSVKISEQFIDQLVEKSEQVKSSMRDSSAEKNYSSPSTYQPISVQSDGLHYAIESVGKIASTQDFTTDVRYTLNPDGTSYLFEVHLIPKGDVQFRRIRKNIFFVIDRSNSIEKKRYEATKEAIKAVLPTIPEEDTFNIFVFDSQVTRFKEQGVNATADAIEEARAFLDRQEFGGLFSSTDIYQSLDKTIPKVVSKEELNVAILLSDGGSSFNKEQKRKALLKWTGDNQRKVSLFSVSTGKKNNYTHLNLLSNYNKGAVKHCPDYDQLSTLLTDLLEEIKDPIGKELVATAVSPDDSVQITLYPKEQRLRDLYSGKRYVLFGTINKLESFHLFLQGKYYDRWLDMKHMISFNRAKVIHFDDIKVPWTLHRSYDCYDQYLQTGNERELSEAKALLKTIHSSSAF